MKRMLAFALILLLAMGSALAEAGAGWRLDAHSLLGTVGEERFAPDLSYELEALAEGSALYAESAVRLGDDELFPMQAMFDGGELTVRLDGSDAYRFDPDSGVFDEPESLSMALALTAANLAVYGGLFVAQGRSRLRTRRSTASSPRASCGSTALTGSTC